jgi:hypothetical protein
MIARLDTCPAIITACVAVAQILALPPPAGAQVDRGWIGKHVVQKSATFDLRVDNRIIDRKNALFFYQVEQVSGPWVWLKADGWNQSRKEYASAIVDLDEAVRLDPRSVSALANRAWIRATCPDARYRDGKTAVESATRACELTGWNDVFPMHALAAACAEAGDFATAVKWETQVLSMVKDEKEKRAFHALIDRYEQKQPYRQTEP